MGLAWDYAPGGNDGGNFLVIFSLLTSFWRFPVGKFENEARGVEPAVGASERLFLFREKVGACRDSKSVSSACTPRASTHREFNI